MTVMRCLFCADLRPVCQTMLIVPMRLRTKALEPKKKLFSLLKGFGNSIRSMTEQRRKLAPCSRPNILRVWRDSGPITTNDRADEASSDDCEFQAEEVVWRG
jgi:hypothetical protein